MTQTTASADQVRLVRAAVRRLQRAQEIEGRDRTWPNILVAAGQVWNHGDCGVYVQRDSGAIVNMY